MPCARLSWPFRQLLSARKYIVSYRDTVRVARNRAVIAHGGSVSSRSALNRNYSLPREEMMLAAGFVRKKYWFRRSRSRCSLQYARSLGHAAVVASPPGGARYQPPPGGPHHPFSRPVCLSACLCTRNCWMCSQEHCRSGIRRTL